jgi:DNA repair exonuclease SbcCD ATPase subunit
MQIAFAAKGHVVMGMSVVLLLLSLPPRSYAMREESQQLTQLLGEARDQAAQLAKDADETQSLIHSDVSWQTHAEALDRIKGDVNSMARVVDKLKETRASGSQLQEQAVDRVMPLLKQLAQNTTDAINYLNQNRTRPLSDPYTEYLQENADTAHELASTVSSLFEYEKSMTKIAQLKDKLELNGQQANN